MKKLLPFVIITAVYATLYASTMVALNGCSSTATPQRKAYTTIDDAVSAATAAMQAFNQRYQQGLQTEADRTKVLAAWAEFQAAARLAVVIAKDPNRVSDPVLLATDAVAQLLALIATLKSTSRYEQLITVPLVAENCLFASDVERGVFAWRPCR